MRRSEGLTLIELLIVTGILGIILGGVMVTVLNGQSLFLSNEVSTQAQEELRRAFGSLVGELRQANPETLEVSDNDQTLDFQQALGYNLALDGCEADVVCWGAVSADGSPKPGWFIRYSVESQPNGSAALIREVLDSAKAEPDQPVRRILAQVNSQASNFTAEDDTVTISLQAENRRALLPGGIAASRVFTTSVKLRNF